MDVPVGFAKDWRLLMANLMAMIATATTSSALDATAVMKGLRFRERTAAAEIRGNRSDNVVVTFADLRLHTAAILRICLDELERA